MATNSWTLRVDSSIREIVENWLKLETIVAHLEEKSSLLDVTFSQVEDAFCFRLKFDEFILL